MTTLMASLSSFAGLHCILEDSKISLAMSCYKDIDNCSVSEKNILNIRYALANYINKTNNIDKTIGMEDVEDMDRELFDSLYYDTFTDGARKSERKKSLSKYSIFPEIKILLTLKMLKKKVTNIKRLF